MNDTVVAIGVRKNMFLPDTCDLCKIKNAMCLTTVHNDCQVQCTGNAELHKEWSHHMIPLESCELKLNSQQNSQQTSFIENLGSLMLHILSTCGEKRTIFHMWNIQLCARLSNI